MTARVTAIIVTYNSRDTIDEAMEAATRCWEEGQLECILVDNASSDGSADHVEANYPWVHIIRSSKNLGFGRACNLGFAEVKTPYVLFINPDACMEPADLGLLTKFLEAHSKVGVVAPTAQTPDGQCHGHGSFPSPWRILAQAAPIPHRNENLAPLIPGDEPRQVHWVSGAVLLFRASVFCELGGFDPRFFLYFEETDLLRRVEQSGHEIWAVPAALALHRGATSTTRTGEHMFSGCISKHYFESRLYYLKKHHGLGLALSTEVTEIVFLAIRSLLCLLANRPGRQELLHRLKGPVLRFPKPV